MVVYQLMRLSEFVYNQCYRIITKLEFLKLTINWPKEQQILNWLETDLSNWNRWGPSDQSGTLNHLEDSNTVKAVKMIQTGEKVSCAKIITFENDPDLRVSPQHFMLHAGDSYRTGEGDERQVAIDYFGLVFHGHNVTHIDSLSHFFWDGKTYNGRPSKVVSTSQGATELDVLPARSGIITRGILVDVPLLRGIEYVERGDGVTMEDIKKFETETGISIEKGDVLLMRTGQLGRRKIEGPKDVYVEGSAGPSPELLPLMHEKQISVMGSDTGNDIQPNPYKKFANPVHQVGIVGMGLWVLDNVWLDDVAEMCIKKNKWEFAFSILPLPLKSVTGSPANPVAIF